MKNSLLLSLFLGILCCFTLSAKPAGNWYSDEDQLVLPGSAVTFNHENFQSEVTLLGNNTILFEQCGNYVVTYSATGSVFTNSLTTGRWSVGLWINSQLVPGSTSGDSNFLTDGVLTIKGRVIIEVNEGDFLQLRNTTSAQIALLGSISSNPTIRNSSTTLVIKALN